MSWQEELRRLDAELASGRINRHEHRKQRDELLAAASGGMAASPVAAPLVSAEAPQSLSGWQSANPGYSPVEPPKPPEPEPEKEPEKPSTSAALLATTRPTSAPSPLDERKTDSMRYPFPADAPTVVTKPVQPSALPSLTPQARHSSGVVRQSSTPVRDKPRGRRLTWAFLAVGVLVVLGMILGATWFFGARTTTGNGSPTAAAADPGAGLESKLPVLPGATNPNNSTMSVDKAVQLQLFTAADGEAIKASGAQEVIYRASSDPANVANGYMLLAIPAPSAAQATQLTESLRKSLTNASFTASPLGPAEADLAFNGTSSTGRVSALWYASGPVAIGIGVSQPLTADAAELRTRLLQIRDGVTATLPAG